MKRICTVLLVMAFVCTASVTALAGNLRGYMFTPLGAPFSETAICANQTGNLTGYSQATSAAADKVGWYAMDYLFEGTYTVGVNENDDYNRMIFCGVQVPASGDKIFDIRYDYNDAVTGMTWDGNLRKEWCQEFMATGTSVISAGMHQAIEFGPTVYASILEGGPTGPQIGPTRSFPTVIANAAAAYWSAGEVPTVPGRIYCVKFWVADGHRPFISGVKVQNSDAFPDGRTWRDGVEVDTPVKCVIGQDDDGLVTTISTKKTGGLTYLSTSCAGISFVANGTSLLSFSCLVGSSGGILQASLHDGVGVNGEGGPQIGFTKQFKSIDWNNRSMVVWAPDEVPLTPGHTYYLKIKRLYGGSFTIYTTPTKECMNATCYNSGNAINYDFSTTVVCEAYPGSATMRKVGVSGVNIARGAGSATISWNTPGVTTTEAYVNFSEKTPYTYKKMAGNSSAHSVTLSGLKPNTLYHARITCKANGYRDYIGRDFVFVTDPATSNLIANPSFETGSYSGWTKFGSCDGAKTGEYFGAWPHTGTYLLGGASSGAACKGGVYQKISLPPGRTVNARAWLWTWQADQIGKGIDYTACGQIGIDPFGGSNPDGVAVVWSPLVAAQDLFGNGAGSWTEVQVSAKPTASMTTIFLRAGANQAMAWTVYSFDDVVVTQEPVLTSLTDLSKIKTTSDGAYVTIPNLVVTATEAQVGAAYVETADRALGCRVESLDTFTVGHTVAVKGYLGTKPSGERYIYSAQITADAAGGGVESLASAAKSVVAVGPSNVGKLMTAVGEVKSAGSGYIYINDGSLAGDGLKVMTGSLGSVPAVGKYIGVTGIVQLESANAPVLWARSDDDVVTYK